MTSAYRAALGETGIEMNKVGYRIADLIGEQYWFKQSTLASIRLLRGRHDFQDLWSPARIARKRRHRRAPDDWYGLPGRPQGICCRKSGARRSERRRRMRCSHFCGEGGLMASVYANGLAISGKATSGKTIAAFPDTCFTPPENPATPPGVPVPYPSFGMASDAENGTGRSKIGGKTVNIKNKSDLSKTSGTESGDLPPRKASSLRRIRARNISIRGRAM